jgi:hypothetical protein
MRTHTHLLLAALFVLCASNAQAQSPGDLDNTFGGSGHVLSDLSAQNRYDEFGMQALIQPDGKRVVVVDRYPYIQLIRFNADGTYDNTRAASRRPRTSTISAGRTTARRSSPTGRSSSPAKLPGTAPR